MLQYVKSWYNKSIKKSIDYKKKGIDKMTLYELNEVLERNDVINIIDVEWDCFETLSLKNKDAMKHIEVVKIRDFYGLSIEIDFTKYYKENIKHFEETFKRLYTAEAFKEYQAFKKDKEISDDDLIEWLIFECECIKYFLEDDESNEQ